MSPNKTSGGEGVKFNLYFPLAPTGRGARGEGAITILSVADFFTPSLRRENHIFMLRGAALRAAWAAPMKLITQVIRDRGDCPLT